MTTLKFSEKLLTVLTAIKQKQALLMSEKSLGLDNSSDWGKLLREYFYDLPDELIVQVGLEKNESCINAIEQFLIPSEYHNPLYQLNEFTFDY